MELQCKIQHYHWGRMGGESTVAKLAGNAVADFKIEDDKNYAELWMGTHNNGPSVIKSTGETLPDYLKKNPEALGHKVLEKFKGEFPFLLKVLSVRQALSIQVHPNKGHAEELHAKYPDRYKDPNHKPEIAIALTEFEGLCGFRPLKEIQEFLVKLPELQSLLGDAATQSLLEAKDDNYSGPMKDAFASLMAYDAEVLKTQVSKVAERIKVSTGDELKKELFERLNKDFPGDIGLFAIFFLNHVKLQPGEAMYLDANVPHAYLLGDCIECMANSDNVVRAGLTPKFIDSETLVNMLQYKCASAEDQKFEGETDSLSGVVLFNPPVPDFAVNMIQISSASDCYSVPVLDSISIFIFVKGTGKYLVSNRVVKEGGITVTQPYASDDIKLGTVLLLPANKILEVFIEDCDQIVAYQAFCKL